VPIWLVFEREASPISRGEECDRHTNRRKPRYRASCHILEAVQRRLDEHPEKMRQYRETAEHPFGTLKMRMGATHFLMKTLPCVATEMALHVLAYNLTRVMNITGSNRSWRQSGQSPPLENRPARNSPAPPPGYRRRPSPTCETSMHPPGRFHTTKTLSSHRPTMLNRPGCP
jgi:hypothetical protein